MAQIRLIYTSRATLTMKVGEALQIAEQASMRNAERGLTGLLAFGNGYFLQVLEGERSEVSSLYQRISADPRHHTLQLLEVTECSERLFSRWGMKLIHLEHAPSRARQIMLERCTGRMDFEPEAFSPTQALNLLLTLGRELRQEE